MQKEVHISSMVVHCRPEFLASIKNHIEHLPGAEIHGESSNGKLVVVLETQGQSCSTDLIEKINNIEHVLGTALVYHQFDQLDSLENDKL